MHPQKCMKKKSRNKHKIFIIKKVKRIKHDEDDKEKLQNISRDRYRKFPDEEKIISGSMGKISRETSLKKTNKKLMNIQKINIKSFTEKYIKKRKEKKLSKVLVIYYFIQ